MTVCLEEGVKHSFQSMAMAAYLRIFNNILIVDSFSSINALVWQYDMFTFLLFGMPSEYEGFVTTVKLKRQKPTMAEFSPACCLLECRILLYSFA